MRKSKWAAYPISQSPLYGLRSKKRLAAVLNVKPPELKRLTDDDRNYHQFVNRPGTDKARSIQCPNPRLKAVHGRLFDLIRRIAPPDYLQSNVSGRSIRTNAGVHLERNQECGFSFDIRAFYPSVKRSYVFDCFYNLFNMESDVADLLADICTFNGHLPTGSPLSGDLAFIANFSMFEKLNALAREFELEFSLYVDDITVTGDRASRDALTQMIGIVVSHGYKCHKIRTHSPGLPRRITGVIVTSAGLRAPNRQHERLHSRLESLTLAEASLDPAEILSASNSVLGSMESIDQIQPQFFNGKKKIRNLQKSIRKLAG